MLTEAYPFGLRDVKITPFTNENTEAAGALIDLPAARTMTFTDAESFTQLRGDDGVVRTRGSGPTGAWELEGGGYKPEVIKTIFGHTLTETGTTPSQIKKLRRHKDDVRPYFKAEGQAMSDSGGDVHVVLFRCRATSDFEGSFKDGEWFITGASGEMFPSLAVGTLGALYDIIQNETATAIA